MATNLTFTTIQQRIKRTLERGTTVDPNFSEDLPFLINDAERKCATELKALLFQRVTRATMVPGQAVYQKPTRWTETISINFGASATLDQITPLLPRSLEFMNAYWPDRSLTAPPELYADYHQNFWLFGPTPDLAYPYEVVDYEQPQLLDDANQTNKLTVYAPRLLWYGTLLACEPYLKNDPRLQTWERLYDRELLAQKGQDADRQTDRSEDRKDRP